MTAGLHRALTALVVAAAFLVGLVALAGSAQAASAPPWEPDPGSVGTLRFYDASGTVVTSGRSDVAPFAKYAVGSTEPLAGNNQAALFFANPDATSTTPFWFKEQVGLYTNYPVTASGTPASLTGLPAGTPVNTGTAADQTVDGFESDSIVSTTSGYQNVVQVRMRTATQGSSGTLKYDVADLMVDPSTHTWTQIYPQVSAATAPGAPTNVSATAGINSANVTWTAPTQNGGSAITGYQVEYSKDQGATFTQVQEKSTATAATITGLTAGTSYVFRVEAKNAAGTGAASPVSAAVTPQAPVLAGAPTAVTATALDNGAVVTWFTPAADGGSPITGYKVEYATSGSDSFTLVPALATSTRATVTGLTNGTGYVFRVAAVTSAGTGPFSDSSAVVTPVADRSALSIGATASVRYGYTATITAKLTDSTTRSALARQPITLYGRHATKGAWSRLKSVTTSSTGTAAFGLKPTSYEQFYWSYAGNAAHTSTASAARAVTVAQTVAVRATATSVKAKSLIRAYGTVAPSGNGQRVYLQVYNRGWKTVTSAVIRYQTLPNHKRATGFVLSVRPAKGSKTYRVYKTATSTLLAGASVQFTLAGR